jgi:L-glutamine-phosphate cytidylyltransferase
MVASKALIVAAGMGTRLRPHTEDKPKCLLEFGGKTLLQRQLDVYKACDIRDIALVRGYRKEKICYEGIRYYDNPDYERNNILNSLFYAEPEINGDLLISYSDILFGKHVVQRLMESEHDISIVVDIDWMGNYHERTQHPLSEAETVIFDANHTVVRIGKIFTEMHEVHGEFIGMIRLRPRGADIFKRHFLLARTLYWGRPFQRAATFEKAYLTDMIQNMVDLGVLVHCVIIKGDWREIDTVEDYERAVKEIGG